MPCHAGACFVLAVYRACFSPSAMCAIDLPSLFSRFPASLLPSCICVRRVLSSVAAELKALQLLISSVSVDGNAAYSSPPASSPTRRARAAVPAAASAAGPAAAAGFGDARGFPLSPSREPPALRMARGPDFAGTPDVGGDMKLDY